MKIANRTFLISGGASGLGLATARDLHAQGGAIAILDLSEDAGAEAVKELGSERANFWECDVQDTESIAAAVNGAAQWSKEIGMEIGGVVAAAGVGFPGLIVDKKGNPLSLDSMDAVLNINLRGTLDLLRQSLPHMVNVKPDGPDGERGVLIMVSSSAAFDGQMGQVAYAASKGAVASATLPMARDLAKHGIRVCTVAPSLFESNMTKMMGEKVRKSLERVMEFPVRAGHADEFARLVRECIGNSMLNGTVIRLDGAMRMPSKL